MRASVAPGKVILTGEHAVVHGGAALAMAVDRHIRAIFVEDLSESLRWKDPLSGQAFDVRSDQLAPQVARIEDRYEQWHQGKLSIQQILQDPSDLFIYTLATAIQDRPMPTGDLTWRSGLPVGAGMGSSASFIAMILKLFTDPTLATLDLMHRVHYCERLQHGKGSLIDASSVTLGGMVRVQQGSVACINPSPLLADFYWIFTGAPESSTGECVAHVSEKFAKASIWDDFAKIESAWLHVSDQERLELIQQNHRLLCDLGVVPKKVQALVQQIEKLGGAAKISGAGSIRGDAGGLVIAYLPKSTPDSLSLPSQSYWGVLTQESAGAKAFSI